MSTQDLAPDEKLCPYCAETIKAAAIRCRFCQSDLPSEPADEPMDEEPTAILEDHTGPDDDEPEVHARHGSDLDATERAAPDRWPGTDLTPDLDSGSRRSLIAMAAVLTVLCLLLAGAFAWVVHRANTPELGKAPNGQVTSGSFRNAAMGAASDAATHVLSYSYATFDADRKAAAALLGGTVATEYDKTMDQVAAQTAKLKLTLKGEVLSVGLISITEHSAKALVFANTLTTREGSKSRQFNQSRLVLTMSRKDGDWTVTSMDPV
jgi:hypothetical protein